MEINNPIYDMAQTAITKNETTLPDIFQICGKEDLGTDRPIWIWELKALSLELDLPCHAIVFVHMELDIGPEMRPQSGKAKATSKHR